MERGWKSLNWQVSGFFVSRKLHDDLPPFVKHRLIWDPVHSPLPQFLHPLKYIQNFRMHGKHIAYSPYHFGTHLSELSISSWIFPSLPTIQVVGISAISPLSILCPKRNALQKADSLLSAAFLPLFLALGGNCGCLLDGCPRSSPVSLFCLCSKGNLGSLIEFLDTNHHTWRFS